MECYAFWHMQYVVAGTMAGTMGLPFYALHQGQLQSSKTFSTENTHHPYLSSTGAETITTTIVNIYEIFTVKYEASVLSVSI